MARDGQRYPCGRYDMMMMMMNNICMCVCVGVCGYLYIQCCLSIHGTHVAANDSTNNIVFFFVSDLKSIILQQQLILDYNALDWIAHSAWAVEYTDCFTAQRSKTAPHPPPKELLTYLLRYGTR